MTGGCTIGGIRRALVRSRSSDVPALQTGELTLHLAAVLPTKGDVEVHAADLLGFFEFDPRIWVRGGEVWVDCEYLATSNKYYTREVRAAASCCTSVNWVDLERSIVPGLMAPRATAHAFRT